MCALWLVKQLWFIVPVTHGNFACLLNYYIKAIDHKQSINQSINQSETKPRTTATCSNAFYPVYWLPIMIGSLRCFCLLRLFGAPFVLVLRHSIQNCSVDGSGYIPRNQYSDEHMKHLGFSFLSFIRPSWSQPANTAYFWRRAVRRETKARNPWRVRTAGRFARKLTSFTLCYYVVSLFNRAQTNHKHKRKRMWFGCEQPFL